MDGATEAAAAADRGDAEPSSEGCWSPMTRVWNESVPTWSHVLQEEVSTVAEMIAGARAISYLANEKGAQPPST